MEFEYLKWLESVAGPTSRCADPQRVLIGIGDDAAVVRTSTATVCCADLLAEGTHFVVRDVTDLALVGRKALAVNLSDIAAMGARPETALLSLLVNRRDALRQAQEVTRGLLELAAEFDVLLVGGDTCSWEGGLVVNVTVNGRLLDKKPLLRSAAQAGDLVLVTGQLGGSIRGQHFRFTPRCREIAALLAAYEIHAATDISDGLVCDFNNVLRASGCGGELWPESIPLAAAAEAMAVGWGETRPAHIPAWPDWPAAPAALLHGLYDGEDFELLLTMDRRAAQDLVDDLCSGGLELDCPLSIIGQISEEPGLRLRVSEAERDRWIDVPDGGYQH